MKYRKLFFWGGGGGRALAGIRKVFTKYIVLLNVGALIMDINIVHTVDKALLNNLRTM
jgi:hypothetical protein